MPFTPILVSPILKERAEYLAHCPQTNLAEHVDKILKKLASPLETVDAIQAVHQFQRLYLVHALDIANHPTIMAAINDEEHFPTWKNFIALKATEAQKNKLAKLMVHGDPDMRFPELVSLSDYSREVGEKVIDELLSLGHEFDLWIDDGNFQRRIMHVMDEPRAEAYGKIMAHRMEASKRSIGFRTNSARVESIDPPAPQNITKKYFDTYTERQKAYFPAQFYTITVLPTETDAELDQIPYNEYVDLFFRMCDVDWDKIDIAHRILIKKLDAGKVLHITNSDGTDITMDIEGFTFANSRVAKNVPGSEVFSAPRRDSANGKVVAKGRFIPRGTKELIEDITLIFKDGKIIEYRAEVGFEHLKDFIELEEGTHYLGEIGIGTNPALQRHITNSLMVEKIGGSFHLGIGGAYQYKEYLGEPVHLDNGNRSDIPHIDVTTMLVGKQGRIILDGKTIMEDGRFTDPALAYLNGTA